MTRTSDKPVSETLFVGARMAKVIGGTDGLRHRFKPQQIAALSTTTKTMKLTTAVQAPSRALILVRLIPPDFAFLIKTMEGRCDAMRHDRPVVEQIHRQLFRRQHISRWVP